MHVACGVSTRKVKGERLNGLYCPLSLYGLIESIIVIFIDFKSVMLSAKVFAHCFP